MSNDYQPSLPPELAHIIVANAVESHLWDQLVVKRRFPDDKQGDWNGIAVLNSVCNMFREILIGVLASTFGLEPGDSNWARPYRAVAASLKHIESRSGLVVTFTAGHWKIDDDKHQHYLRRYNLVRRDGHVDAINRSPFLRAVVSYAHGAILLNNAPPRLFPFFEGYTDLAMALKKVALEEVSPYAADSNNFLGSKLWDVTLDLMREACLLAALMIPVSNIGRYALALLETYERTSQIDQIVDVISHEFDKISSVVNKKQNLKPYLDLTCPRPSLPILNNVAKKVCRAERAFEKLLVTPIASGHPYFMHINSFRERWSQLMTRVPARLR